MENMQEIEFLHMFSSEYEHQTRLDNFDAGHVRG